MNKCSYMWYYAHMNESLLNPISDIARNPNGQLRPGVVLNPRGRPPGSVSGRTRALQILDEISSKEDNAALLADAMDKAMKKNPLGFFLKYMAPLMPKEAIHKITAEAAPVHRWQSLLDACRENESAQSELQAIRADYPSQDSKILGLLADGIPLTALRNQMGAIRLPPSSEPADL